MKLTVVPIYEEQRIKLIQAEEDSGLAWKNLVFSLLEKMVVRNNANNIYRKPDQGRKKDARCCKSNEWCKKLERVRARFSKRKQRLVNRNV